ncbi:cyclin-dependent kinase inhibitor 3 family protein [Pseudomonas sp. RIT288]|uniref:cyclin-dependent kinase inhibitor 3 family protein n=1 Tax=Pseudomonas sp. RIT288 TaxID=1470589 RepID=UPI0004504ADB|nr:cyclin-dependent kinase inhibitor 3 family protein [Pseudomonas sp. RIT288]EZP32694.1 phosphatase [Pseudomonas sp. RIT288]
MSHPFSILVMPDGAGTLIFTPCPGTQGESLQQALATLKNAGASAIVSLMSDAELTHNGVGELGQQVQAAELAWYQLPIEDDEAPDAEFEARWQKALPELSKLLDANRAIAIHCKGGSGRTGLVAAKLMIDRGMPRARAVELVQQLRPRAIQKPSHVSYIERL